MTDAQKIAAVVAALGVLVAVAALGWQVISWRRTGPEISAELCVGEVDEIGVLTATMATGASVVMRLRSPSGESVELPKKRGRRGNTPKELSKTPANAIFIRNAGRTAITIRRCRYVGPVGPQEVFTFEPQPASSPWGDHLPKRLEAGEEAILVHERVEMRIFLHKVLKDHGVAATVFAISLSLGNGKDVLVDGCMRARADMSEDEFAKHALRITRDEIENPAAFIPPRRRFGRSTRQALIMQEELEDK